MPAGQGGRSQGSPGPQARCHRTSASSQRRTGPAPRTSPPGRMRAGRIESFELRLRAVEIEMAGMDLTHELRNRGQPREIRRPVLDQVQERRRRLVVAGVAEIVIIENDTAACTRSTPNARTTCPIAVSTSPVWAPFASIRTATRIASRRTRTGSRSARRLRHGPILDALDPNQLEAADHRLGRSWSASPYPDRGERQRDDRERPDEQPRRPFTRRRPAGVSRERNAPTAVDQHDPPRRRAEEHAERSAAPPRPRRRRSRPARRTVPRTTGSSSGW